MVALTNGNLILLYRGGLIPSDLELCYFLNSNEVDLSGEIATDLEPTLQLTEYLWINSSLRKPIKR